MNKKMLTFFLAIALLLPRYVLAEANTFYPSKGAFAYDGADYVYLDFEFSESSTWNYWLNYNLFTGQQGLERGLEMDIAIKNTYFDGCVTFSSFRDKYNDCPTAGWTENNIHLSSFGCGTYSGLQFEIESGSGARKRHHCEFEFDRASEEVLTSNVYVSAQVVKHSICPFDWPWCMNGEVSEPLNTIDHQSSVYNITYGELFNGEWGNWPYASTVLALPVIQALLLD